MDIYSTKEQQKLIQQWKSKRSDDRLMAGAATFFAAFVALDFVMSILGKWSIVIPVTLPISFISIMIGLTLRTGDIAKAWRQFCQMPRDVILNYRSFYVAANPTYDEKEIRDWVKINCRWLAAPRKAAIWEFSSEEDAMRFKLVWM